MTNIQSHLFDADLEIKQIESHIFELELTDRWSINDTPNGGYFILTCFGLKRTFYKQTIKYLVCSLIIKK